ncbi:hypothetical protein Kpho02_71490 [Kitasatospora phosalacinea]|uniref:Uncharacterized protein n=1 Tax=Kitasatospora phosalacinea TaxID=2065 RepID=A0A9W6V734_9ACTN|nr:hypothetical protein [Kitasatospora phosalacinea]GLW74852.1 hypothetical protein Kpho02_71490 [Kitasatospora phosalacinea]
MENWDFREWQAALSALDGRGAALVGLAAATRISGCLGDERFRRHGDSGSAIVTELLRKCWTDAANDEGASPAELQELVDRLADWSREYTDLSLAELFRSYGTPVGDGEDEDAVDLDDFMEQAVPEGAVMAHLDALNAVSEAVVACARGPWDGALRCLQTAAVAAGQGDPRLPGPGVELQRQREDLELVRASSTNGWGPAAAELRARAEADARGWQQATERLDLLHD